MTNRETAPEPASVGGGTVATTHALFFLSGAAALVYEVSWSRQVGLTVGNTAAAAAIVLASYFAGMAAGQLLGGRLAPRLRPLTGYGVAELLAAAWAGLVPALLSLAGPDAGVIPGGAAGRAAWCFAVLLPPTVALGATLPFMAAFLGGPEGRRGRRVALAYGLNTAGGLVGVLAATSVLLVGVGVRGSGYLAAGISAGVGILACTLAATQRPSDRQASRLATPRMPSVAAGWWAVSAVSGFGTLGLEVLYTRMFSLVFHNSTYTFGAVVAVFLAGLALGAAVVAAVGRRVSPRSLVAASSSLGAVAVAASVVLFLRLTGLEYFTAGDTFAGYLTRALGLVAAVVLPPVILLGMALPAAFAAAGGGRAVGRLAAVNTFSAAAGALASGFFLVPWLGLWEAFGLLAFLFGVTGAAVLYFRARRPVLAGVVGLLAAAAAAVAASGGAQVPAAAGEDIVRRWETPYGWIDVVRRRPDDSLTVRQNLHYRHGSTGRNAAREHRQGRLPLLLHPRPSEVVFLGLGTGLTAAPAVADRDVGHVTVVELIPEVVEAARLLSDWNFALVDHPKVEVRLDDARHYLGRTDRRFDVIVSDLFVPWESRAGYLYTVEFYEAARRRLTPGGHFCQWLALYQLGPGEFELVADSFAAAFPHVTLWWGQFDTRFGMLALVGSDEPLDLAPSRLSARWAAAGDPPGDADPDLPAWAALPELFLGGWPARPSRPLNTDEYPRLEFQAPVSHRSRRTLQGEELCSYFDCVLANLPSDGVSLRGGWPPAVTDAGRRRALQRLRLFGP